MLNFKENYVTGPLGEITNAELDELRQYLNSLSNKSDVSGDDNLADAIIQIAKENNIPPNIVNDEIDSLGYDIVVIYSSYQNAGNVNVLRDGLLYPIKYQDNLLQGGEILANTKYLAYYKDGAYVLVRLAVKEVNTNTVIHQSNAMLTNIKKFEVPDGNNTMTLTIAINDKYNITLYGTSTFERGFIHGDNYGHITDKFTISKADDVVTIFVKGGDTVMIESYSTIPTPTFSNTGLTEQVNAVPNTSTYTELGDAKSDMSVGATQNNDNTNFRLDNYDYVTVPIRMGTFYLNVARFGTNFNDNRFGLYESSFPGAVFESSSHLEVVGTSGLSYSSVLNQLLNAIDDLDTDYVHRLTPTDVRVQSVTLNTDMVNKEYMDLNYIPGSWEGFDTRLTFDTRYNTINPTDLGTMNDTDDGDNIIRWRYTGDIMYFRGGYLGLNTELKLGTTVVPEASVRELPVHVYSGIYGKTSFDAGYVGFQTREETIEGLKIGVYLRRSLNNGEYLTIYSGEAGKWYSNKMITNSYLGVIEYVNELTLLQNATDFVCTDDGYACRLGTDVKYGLYTDDPTTITEPGIVLVTPTSYITIDGNDIKDNVGNTIAWFIGAIPNPTDVHTTRDGNMLYVVIHTDKLRTFKIDISGVPTGRLVNETDFYGYVQGIFYDNGLHYRTDRGYSKLSIQGIVPTLIDANVAPESCRTQHVTSLGMNISSITGNIGEPGFYNAIDSPICTNIYMRNLN